MERRCSKCNGILAKSPYCPTCGDYKWTIGYYVEEWNERTNDWLRLSGPRKTEDEAVTDLRGFVQDERELMEGGYESRERAQRDHGIPFTREARGEHRRRIDDHMKNLKYRIVEDDPFNPVGGRPI